jgi:hypothetical protein
LATSAENQTASKHEVPRSRLIACFAVARDLARSACGSVERSFFFCFVIWRRNAKPRNNLDQEFRSAEGEKGLLERDRVTRVSNKKTSLCLSAMTTLDLWSIVDVSTVPL